MGPTLAQWSAKISTGTAPTYTGTALRALATQLEHQAGLTDFAAALAAEVGRAPDYELFDLLPTARSATGYWHLGTPYVVHPDASFVLAYQGQWRPYCLEFERRATTPRRVPARLESYRRYFQSGWAARDHDGQVPRVLFVFESPADEAVFLRVAALVERAPFLSSNLTVLAERGVLGNSWRRPPPPPSERGPLWALDSGAQ